MANKKYTKEMIAFQIKMAGNALNKVKDMPPSIRNKVKANIKKLYSEMGVGKPKGNSKTTPSMSAKKSK